MDILVFSFLTHIIIAVALFYFLMRKINSVQNNISGIVSIIEAQSTADVTDHAHKDRLYLLLLLAKSYGAVDKLRLEKKHPNSPSIVIVLETKKGDLRFSVMESDFPSYLKQNIVGINTGRLDFKRNYNIIEDLISKGVVADD